MIAIDALRRSLELGDPTGLADEKPRESYTLDGAIWRFLRVWENNRVIGPDHAVAFRQIARWQGQNLFVGKLPPSLEEYSGQTDFEVTPAGTLKASPFTPNWLRNDCINNVQGIDGRPTVRRFQEEIVAESYLASLGYTHWQSQAQKEATWLALTSPPGSTTLIALPTGSGKSLCFQILSRFRSGLTVVVVPTVALAMDQWRSAKEVLGGIPDLNPQYFAADDTNLNPETVISDVREGRTRLLFTSPEACVSGRLRYALDEAAQRHQLENLVVDEAHIIESWGAYFRVDFQMLATLTRRWSASTDSGLRTYLLSATFTPRTRSVLQKLFGTGGGEWREFISQRLRPEMTYYSHSFPTIEAQQRAVRECAWRLPRPAIIYTTEVAEAKRFAQLLRHEGFKRLGCFHGETRTAERRSLLAKWRNDDIDVMVATSAFGLGVDKPDVRTVVHACMPENLHRYYQEVGRGGRDGASSICILIPTEKDYEVAKGLTPRLLSEEIVQKRWESMWQDRENISQDDFTWKLNTGSRRTELLGQRTYNENVRWNKRLILQLLRAGKLEVLDVEYRKEEEGVDPSEWVAVKIKFSPTAHDIGTSIADQREQEMMAAAEGLNQIQSYLTGQRSICKVLRSLYAANQRVCGGCKACRQEGRPVATHVELEFDGGPSGSPPCKIVTDCPDPFLQKGENTFKSLLRKMVGQKRLHRFACEPSVHQPLMDLFGRAFSQAEQSLYRLDAFHDDPSFHLLPIERIVFFHFGQLNQHALKFDRGNEVVHLIGAGVNYIDKSGRYPNEARGSRIFPSPELWLSGG
jgi:ATP-dependent DNA helicase RecQ